MKTFNELYESILNESIALKKGAVYYPTDKADRNYAYLEKRPMVFKERDVSDYDEKLVIFTPIDTSSTFNPPSDVYIAEEDLNQYFIRAKDKQSYLNTIKKSLSKIEKMKPKIMEYLETLIEGEFKMTDKAAYYTNGEKEFKIGNRSFEIIRMVGTTLYGTMNIACGGYNEDILVEDVKLSDIKKILKYELERGKMFKEWIASYGEITIKNANNDIKKAEDLIKKSKTWFTIENKSSFGFKLETRKNGNVGSEEVGALDIKEGKRLKKLLSKLNLDINIEYVDEFVILDITTK